MLNEAKKMVEVANDLKDFCAKQMLDPDMFMGMNGEVFEMYQKTFKLMDISMNLVLEQAELFDAMDKKLDLLVKKLEA